MLKSEKVFYFPTAPEDIEASVSATLPVLLSAGWWHPPGDGACAALGDAAGQPLPGGDLRRHLRPPAGAGLSAREGERKVAWGKEFIWMQMAPHSFLTE